MSERLKKTSTFLISFSHPEDFYLLYYCIWDTLQSELLPVLAAKGQDSVFSKQCREKARIGIKISFLLWTECLHTTKFIY
jgi:hypothetical protein